MSASSKKRGISVLGPDHSPSNGKRAKTAGANPRSDTTPTATPMTANTKTTRASTLPQSPGTRPETPTPHPSSSASAPSSPSPSSSSVSASSSDPASTTSDLERTVPPSPSPSPSPSSPSSTSASGSTSSSPSSGPSPRLPQPPSQTPPTINLSSLASTARLRARLSSFLPALAAANRELELERAAGRLAERDIENLGTADGERGEGGSAYIEMELGLGVLEERRGGGEGEGEDEAEVGVGGGGEVGGEEDVLGELLGRGRRRGTRPGIELLDAM